MGAQACAQIGRYLPRYGWTPVVLTVRGRHMERTGARPVPAFPGRVIRTTVIPHPFTVYRWLKLRFGLGAEETASDGASPDNVRKGRCLRRWLLSLLAVPDAYTGWIPSAVMSGLRAIRKYEVEHLFSSAPHWTSHLVGLALARLSGLPWTAHFRDPWTGPAAEMARLKPISALSMHLEAALERMVVRRADVVVCVTEEHAALLRRAHPEASAGKFVTIPNGFDGAEWEDLAGEDDRHKADEFVITYAGTLYNRRSPVPVFRALKALIDAGEVVRGRLRVELLGRCDMAEGRRVSELAAACGLDGCVRLTGPLGRAETLRRMIRSDLLLLFAEGLTLQVPGKTYEYLRAGRPILALAPEGAVADLLRRTGGAWLVHPADEPGVTAALREAYCAWEEGRLLPQPDPGVVATYDRRVLAGRFAQLFDRRAAEVRPARVLTTHPPTLQ